jgi:aspartate ammonia-lyase
LPGIVENSIGLVTALNPVLGYEIRRHRQGALKTGGSVYELAPPRLAYQEKLDELLNPKNATHPRLNR